MITLYGIIAVRENAEILTMLSISLLCIVYIYHLWRISGLTGKRFTTWEWVKIYFFSIIIFLCGSCSFAKMFFPDNADALLDLLHLSGILEAFTIPYQTLLLKIIRLLI